MSRPAKKSPANDQSASAREAGVAYTPMLRDLPQDMRPRERMLMAGPGALSNAELLAILLRIGVAGESVVHVAENLLVRFGGLPGIAQANFEELCAVNGVGPAKATQLKAALEIGRRLLLALPQERLQIRSPSDISDLADAGDVLARTRAHARRAAGHEEQRFTRRHRLHGQPQHSRRAHRRGLPRGDPRQLRLDHCGAQPSHPATRRPAPRMCV